MILLSALGPVPVQVKQGRTLRRCGLALPAVCFAWASVHFFFTVCKKPEIQPVRFFRRAVTMQTTNLIPKKVGTLIETLIEQNRCRANVIISFIQSCVWQSGDPLPVITLSAVSDELVYLWNVPNTCFWSLPQLSPSFVLPQFQLDWSVLLASAVYLQKSTMPWKKSLPDTMFDTMGKNWRIKGLKFWFLLKGKYDQASTVC